VNKEVKGMKKEILSIRIDFQEPILGSWPANEELLTRFITAKAPSPWQEEEEKQSIDPESKGLTVFPQDESGLFLWNFHLKGFLKEAGNVLKDSLKVKNLRSKIDNYVFIQPRKLYLKREDKHISEPDDIFERPLRAQTMQGPRVALTGSERIYPPCSITAAIEILENKEITPDLIRDLLDYGQYKGLGQWRNGGFGSFTWLLNSDDALIHTA